MLSEYTKDNLRPWKNIGKDLPRVLVVKTIVVRKSLGPKGLYEFESRLRYKWLFKVWNKRKWLKFMENDHIRKLSLADKKTNNLFEVQEKEDIME